LACIFPHALLVDVGNCNVSLDVDEKNEALETLAKAVVLGCCNKVGEAPGNIKLFETVIEEETDKFVESVGVNGRNGCDGKANRFSS
jgi:hypothetical protein